jgi:diguanylate cyclase (GGDEF)-like protein
MNKLTLRQRLLLLSLLPSTIIAALLVAYFTYSGMQTLENELHKTGLATVRYLAPISEYGIIAGQNDGLYNLVQATLQQPGIKAAMVVNRKGRTIAVSGRVSLGAEIFQQPLAAPALVAESDSWIAYGAPVLRSTNEIDPIFESLLPLNADTPEVIGQVFIELDKEELRVGQRGILLRGLAIIAVGMLIIYILTIGMAENIARPILRLVNAVRSMSTGQFETRVLNDSPGEVGELEYGFNEMAGRVEEVHQSMQERIEEATSQLAFQARHDALTGLLNRREFESRLEKLLAGIQAGGSECSFLFIDLDRFKPVNDLCGHLAGDELLRQIAQLLQGRLREGDILGRLGGDEFGILLPNCSGLPAKQVANDICNLTAAYRFIWQDKVFAIGASIGLSTITQRVRKISDVLAAADAACYRAKEGGRNQVAEQDAAIATERRLEATGWQERIINALKEKRILIEAQPIRALQTGSPAIHRVELAARLNEPGQAAVSLAALINAAERYELAPSIDRLLLDSAIATLSRTQRAGKAIHCLVPISPSSLILPETVDYIRNALSSAGVQGEGLCIVFSEDNAGRHIGQVIQLVRNLKTLGCEVVIDDFGGGISSFSHLRTLTPKYIKLSHSLTRELAGNRASTALLRAIVEIADDLDIQTIADEVDNLQMLANLAELNIRCAKGYAVGPNEPFDAWLEGAVMRGMA